MTRVQRLIAAVIFAAAATVVSMSAARAETVCVDVVAPTVLNKIDVTGSYCVPLPGQ